MLVTTDDAVPAGFGPFTRESPLLAPWRPIFARIDPERVVLGVRSRPPHTNSRETVHGGFVAALADQAMGMSCGIKLQAAGVTVKNLWTTSLTIDYLGTAGLGAWLQFETVFAHCGRHSCHAELDVTADGKTVARARGAFRVAAG